MKKGIVLLLIGFILALIGCQGREVSHYKAAEQKKKIAKALLFILENANDYFSDYAGRHAESIWSPYLTAEETSILFAQQAAITNEEEEVVVEQEFQTGQVPSEIEAAVEEAPTPDATVATEVGGTPDATTADTGDSGDGDGGSDGGGGGDGGGGD